MRFGRLTWVCTQVNLKGFDDKWCGYHSASHLGIIFLPDLQQVSFNSYQNRSNMAYRVFPFHKSIRGEKSTYRHGVDIFNSHAGVLTAVPPPLDSDSPEPNVASCHIRYCCCSIFIRDMPGTPCEGECSSTWYEVWICCISRLYNLLADP